MRPHPTPDHPRIVLLKVALKLMFLALLAALAVVMGRAFLPEAEPPPEPLRVDVARLAVDGVQGVEWNHQRLLIIHRGEGPDYLVVADYDPFYGCPLRWVTAGAAEAPQQPWHGGLRAICTEHWYDANGVSLTPGIADLKRLPFTLDEPATVVITAPSN